MNAIINLEQERELRDAFVVRTNFQTWRIPAYSDIFKMLINREHLSPSDLEFNSKKECQQFIRQTFLLAMEDEIKSETPSSLAMFAQKLAAISENKFVNDHRCFTKN